MITWMTMVSSRDRPREGARGAQRTYRGVHVDDHMDGHGEQPGPNPGGGAGRSENLQGRGPEEGTEHTGVAFLSLFL